jgi:hypothetical protein
MLRLYSLETDITMTRNLLPASLHPQYPANDPQKDVRNER